MKILVLLVSLLFATPMMAHAQSQKDACDKAAWSAANSYFKQYTADFEKEAKKSLRRGEKFDTADLPQELYVDSKQNGVFSFAWTERQECICGVLVNTTPNAQTCDAKVDVKSLECDCG